jgi:hypothetical protein
MYILFYRNYSQASCKLECGLQYAQSVSEISCTPWFFPTQDQPIRMCNPWETITVNNLMFREIPDDECKRCLPDCSGTQFSTSMAMSPFRRCDYKNLGVSYLCNLGDPELPEPRIWGGTVLREYGKRSGDVPKYVSLQVT